MRDPEPETNTVRPWEDELDTLVFDRDDVRVALERALAQLGEIPPTPLAPPRLVVVPEDDDVLADLPPAARAVLERVAVPVPSDAPRLSFAVARPARAPRLNTLRIP